MAQDSYPEETVSANTIGQVARRAGVGVETVRFYERKGLIEQPDRKGGGYRQYPDDAVQRIRFIVHARQLGFTLKEIIGLLSLRAHSAESCHMVKAQAEEKIASVDNKIQGLRRMKVTLTRLTKACGRREPSAECPILDALDERDYEA